MSEQQKTVEVPEIKTETAPDVVVAQPTLVEPPAAETTIPSISAATKEDAPVDETTNAETTEEPKVEEEKEDVKPIEEGHLSHKAQGLSFPKNLIPSKEFFFFGTDAFEPKSLSHYLRTEKSTETAHKNIAWASQTGEGLLFVGDKKTPSSVISLADATEPEIDGTHKFHFSAKGNKHTFKATTTAERDNWVSQLKLKIAEAKELSATVTESETYKQTIESYKPAPIVKKEATPEPTKEEVAPAEAVPVVAAATTTEETPKEEETKEEVKSEEPKRRSASRKRASFFGFGKKDEKKEAKPAEEAVTPTEAPVAETPVVEAPIAETEVPKPEEAIVLPVVPVAETETAPATEEVKPSIETPVESPKEKPANTKRNSFFGGVFSKKEKKSPELKPTEPTEAPKEGETAELAPVIPPVEATTPLAVDVSSPATVPVESTEISPATDGEAKKLDVKEKRKSSLPFGFGKRDKSPGPVEDEKKSPFSKLRATINRKTSSSKTEEKPTEEAVKDEPVKEEGKEDVPVIEEPATQAEPEAENKPENVTTATPAVTAAA
ncbi:hypothetical protein G7046_g1128 [Stylonectria norvegica]|nr:hypothetical protein G7046_g1128 [Stylonectria norvegica]